MKKIEIKNLHVKVEEQLILKGINLVINAGEIHALMGPNGNGKSTLLLTIMGHPSYIIVKGDILIDGKSILLLTVDERSRLGIFLAMQSPAELSGVINLDFYRSIINSHSLHPIKLPELFNLIQKNIDSLHFNETMLQRYLNYGFSGGEKKKNEIFQLNLLKPQFALIDEIDSGLDVDALNLISKNINLHRSNSFMALIVSHYNRFFNLVPPTHVHILIAGKIVYSGNKELVDKINNEGYEWIIKKQELKIESINKKTILDQKPILKKETKK